MSTEDERTVRQELDRVVGKALIEPEFCSALLADNPYGIRAVDLHEFARQAFSKFWIVS